VPCSGLEGFRRRAFTATAAIALVSAVSAAAASANTVASTNHNSASPGSGGAGVGSTGAPGAATGPHHYPGDSRHLGDRILREGMHGHDVRVLQAYLTQAGFGTQVDGQFGSGTEASVVAFQRSKRLRANGVVTWAVSQALRADVAAFASVDPPVGRARLSGGLAIAPSTAPEVVKEVIAAANKIAFSPYVYGGGHGSFRSSGYDCSGSVSFALHGGRLLSSPEDSTQLESYGDAGPGQWITIWANAGHAYMIVAGLRFDTASIESGASGSRWSRQRRSSAGYIERHPVGL
jgi:peptidoglycan hydrolase-like protein with peptidoglycan-binding domain